MAQDVIITPADGEIQWQDNASGVAFADIDANNNLSITNPGGNLSIGDGSSDVYIGNGAANVDLVFEQDGEIRGTGSQTLTLGTSGDTIEVASGTTFSVQTDLSFAANPEITWTSNYLDLYSRNAIGVVRILGNASYAPRFEIYTDAGTTQRIQLDPGATSFIDGANAKLGIGTASPSTTFSVQNTLTYNASTRLLEVINSGNAGGLNISGANGRLYMGGARALEGSGTATLTVGESFNAVSMLKSVYMATASGSVGIGTTSPGEKLEIQQNGNYQLKLTNGSTGGGNVRIAYADNTFGSGGSKVIFDLDNGGSANAEFVIQSDGNVGIGTTSPKAPLHVGTGSAGNYMGGKTFTLSNTFADALSIELPDHRGCYVKIFVTGDWSSHSAVAYTGEFFIQNGANGYNQPGLIISETDNTYNGSVSAQIVDSTTDTFKIQLKLSATGSLTAQLSYQIMGTITSIS